MKMWKGNGNTTTLLFSLKGLEILHQEGRVQVNTMVMEHFNNILFHEFGSVYQSIIQSIYQSGIVIEQKKNTSSILVLEQVQVFSRASHEPGLHGR